VQWSSPIEDASSPVTAGELAELRDHFLNLARQDQQALLDDARRRRYRRR
jgi:hypothetical protein